ncbi:M1 family metallopeptidase [Flaviaesturariibacter amylovorans]|uniref:Peptidase M1 membrane alanine aminopeptidase domain-containing protein n=1 Tax=Flaviaesturariibacter amylovorans TaxID=1084520 RepID=A0ABP8H2J4_9BACT
MKAILPFLLLLCLGNPASGQYWQQRTDYVIEATLHPRARTLDGFERLTYHNASPDTLRYIWFHLWPNAYKNDRTAFSDQLLRNGRTDFYFATPEKRGYINRLDFRVNGQAARTEDHPQHIDIVKLHLPAPLAPGASAQITTPFHVKLPYAFSRSGWDGAHFNITQWYPKPAVYDATGWHPMPYLDQGEFYSEFGSFDVRLTVPENYTVAATGQLQDTAELRKLRTWKQVQKPTTVTPAAGNRPGQRPGTRPAGPALPPESGVTKTLRYLQDSVHDFAWFANPDFHIKHDTLLLPSGRKVDLFLYSTSNPKDWEQLGPGYVKDALRFYSREMGEYPFSTLSVVQGPESSYGGMEYPTIAVIDPSLRGNELDATIAHEIGHNWFQGILASNERDHPWMDEGFNTFYENRYFEQKYGAGKRSQWERLLFLTQAQQRLDQPISTPSDSLSALNYSLVPYYKTAAWLASLERYMGRGRFRAMMRGWYERWRFRHPQPGDFAGHVHSQEPGGTGPGSHLGFLATTGPLPAQELRGTRIVTPLQVKSLEAYDKTPVKHTILLTPALGANRYDKLMIGALVSNMKLPPTAFQFLAAPLYATGSKRWNGIGYFEYSGFPERGGRKWQLFGTASTFTYNQFEDEKGTKHFARFYKLAPGVSFSWRPRDPRSTLRRSIDFRSFFIGEQPFRISFDSVISPVDTTLVQNTRTESLRYGIHQLRFRIGNSRALYPWSAAAWVQASEHFVRLHLEGQYFFNYAGGGGLSARLFAGKLFYDANRRLPYGLYANRFFLNMSGAGGEEDYTYSHYFAGRTEFEGLASQQIAIRDGGFKVRTPLYSNPVGQSDDWLAAINLNTSVPDKINPLALLPVRIPLHLFLDIGTHAGAWKANAEGGRFLYDAGLHVPIARGVLNFYFPVIYSPQFREYVQSVYTKGRFFRSMTFSIDLGRAGTLLKRDFLF